MPPARRGRAVVVLTLLLGVLALAPASAQAAFTISGTPANGSTVETHPLTVYGGFDYLKDRGLPADCRAYCFAISPRYTVTGTCNNSNWGTEVFSDAYNPAPPGDSGRIYRTGGESPLNGRPGWVYGFGHTTSGGVEQSRTAGALFVDTRKTTTITVHAVCRGRTGFETIPNSIGATFTMTFKTTPPGGTGTTPPGGTGTCPAGQTGTPPNCRPASPGTNTPVVPTPTPTTPSGSNGGGNSNGTLRKRRCKVPKLVGLTVRQARKRLKRAGCRLGVTRPKRPPRGALVRSSKPRAGRLLPLNAKVKVFLAKPKRTP